MFGAKNDYLRVTENMRRPQFANLHNVTSYLSMDETGRNETVFVIDRHLNTLNFAVNQVEKPLDPTPCHPQ